MKKMNEVFELSKDLYDHEESVGNIKMMEGVHKMIIGDWNLDGKPKWFRNQPSSEPFDAWRDAVDLFSTMNPKLRVTPYSGSEADKRKADKLEQALMWQAKRLRNRSGDVHKKVIENAFEFGRAAGQLFYLPYMKDTMKVFGGSEKRLKLAQRYGDFLMIPKDSRTVYPYFSDYMLEGVLSVNFQPVQKVIDFWGEKLAKPLIKEKTKEDRMEWCTVFDYWDIDQRAVWFTLHETQPHNVSIFKGTELFNDNNDLPFLPWVVQDLGDPLMPLLYPIYQFDYYHTMCLMESTLTSEVIQYIMAPRYSIQNGRVVLEFGEAGTVAEIEGPQADFQPLPPPGIDRALSEMVDRLAARVSKSTISHNVQTGDFGSGNPYAAIREIIDLQVRRLNDSKAIVSKFWEESYKQMLWWADHMGDNLVAYGERKDGGQIVVMPQNNIPSEISDEDMGELVTFNPDRLFFEVEMLADIPEDQVGRMNAAKMYLDLNGSYRKALEIAGVADSTEEMEQRRLEDVEQAQHEANLASIARRKEIDDELYAQTRAQEMMGAMPQMQGGGGGGAPLPAGNTGTGFENLGGQGFDPAMGGIPPQIGNPEGTREIQQGRNREGGV